jgi:uncharacterized protein YndB with AHSA1/START domain
MADIIHRIGIKAPVSKVYAALATVDGVAGWWTTETSGESKAGGVMTFAFRNCHGEELGKMVMNVVGLNPDQDVHWRVSAGAREWIGTDLTFHLSQQGDQTIVLFAHKNWQEAGEFMAHCSMKWATFLLSLRDLVETGRGKPAPVDLKIDNWN